MAALPEGLIDPLLKTVTFARGDKPVVRLHYYATHPQSFYGDPRVSMDFAGLAREKLEREEGIPQVYFTGCAGDIAAGKYNDGTPRARDELTRRLWAGMKAAAAATQFSPLGTSSGERFLGVAAEGRSRLRSTSCRPPTSRRSRICGSGRPAHRVPQRIDRPLELSSPRCGRLHVLHLFGEPMVAFQLYAQQLAPYPWPLPATATAAPTTSARSRLLRTAVTSRWPPLSARSRRSCSRRHPTTAGQVKRLLQCIELFPEKTLLHRWGRSESVWAATRCPYTPVRRDKESFTFTIPHFLLLSAREGEWRHLKSPTRCRGSARGYGLGRRAGSAAVSSVSGSIGQNSKFEAMARPR